MAAHHALLLCLASSKQADALTQSYNISFPLLNTNPTHTTHTHTCSVVDGDDDDDLIVMDR